MLGSGRQGAGRYRSLRSSRPGNVAFPWRNRGCQADHSDDDEDDRIGIAARKITAARLDKEKQYADGKDDRRAHQAANRTRSAYAANTVTHRKKPPKNGGRAVCASSKRPRQSEALAKKTGKCGTRETNQNCGAATAARRQSAGSAQWGALS